MAPPGQSPATEENAPHHKALQHTMPQQPIADHQGGFAWSCRHS